MKLFKLGSLITEKLTPKTSRHYDTEETKPTATTPTASTITDDERRTIAENSFRKGMEKAKADKELQAKLTRLEELEKTEAERIENMEVDEITNNLKDKTFSNIIKGGYTRFAKEHKETLKGKTGDELLATIKQIKNSASTEDKELFFIDEAEINASGSLKEAVGKKETKKPTVEYFPGTTIRKN